MDVEKIKETPARPGGWASTRGCRRRCGPPRWRWRTPARCPPARRCSTWPPVTATSRVACAREGASVVASDLAPGMVEKGRRGTEAEGYDIEWVEADAEDLPFEDGRFECVGSVFGAMIAPRPRVVAEEMFRVVRPGNTVGMTAWTPESPISEMFQVGRSTAAADPRRAAPRGVGRRGHGARALRRPGQLDRDGARDAALGGRLAGGVHRPDGASMRRCRRRPRPRCRPTLRARCARRWWAWRAGGPVATGRSRWTREYMLIVARRRG